METSELIYAVALCGIMGMVGQVIRVAVGMKKVYDKAADQGSGMPDLFETSRLSISLLMGFAVGVISMLLLDGQEILSAANETSAPIDRTDPEAVKSAEAAAKAAKDAVKELLIGVAAAGYAGTDAVEGLFKRYLPGLAAK